MAKKSTKTDESMIEVPEITIAAIQVSVVGTSPLLCNRMPAKAKQELMLPAGRKTGAARATLKHNPYEEFVDAVYRFEANDPVLAVPATAFKAAMVTACSIVPGAVKARIRQTVWVNGEYVPIWGVPLAYTRIVRLAGPDRTPDVRTRAIIPQWAATLTISYIPLYINETMLVRLLAAAGQVGGIGDWRAEKGGSYGQFRPVNDDDPLFQEIVATGGRMAQLAALASPEPYDEETRELLSWFNEETRRRGIAVNVPQLLTLEG